MVKEPAKKQIQNLIDSLLKSEIPELQSVAKGLTDWTKELEKHSWQLQQYASQLEELIQKQMGQAPTEVSLAELVRDLETTLVELRKRPADSTPKTDMEETEKAENAKMEATETVTTEAELPRKSLTPRLTKVTGTESGLYRTPEGFLVRRRRL